MNVKRLVASGLLLAGLLLAACGGGDDDETTSPAATGGTASTGATGTTGATGAATSATGATGGDTAIPASEADRVAHAALPALEDLPGSGWVVIAEDDFDTSGGADFLASIQGNPDCETLENLAALASVFGGEEEETPVGQAQIEFEKQTATDLIPTSVEVEVEVDESAAGSTAQFTIVKDLFESDETSNCIISALNKEFAETGPPGVEIIVTKGEPVAEAPENGATMAFDVEMSAAGIELAMAMQMYFWPDGNATAQAMFLGTAETLNADLVGGVLDTVDENLKAAAGE